MKAFGSFCANKVADVILSKLGCGVDPFGELAFGFSKVNFQQ